MTMNAKNSFVVWGAPEYEAEGDIGTLRRDCLDNVIVLDDLQAERILRQYLRYYHGRPHRGLRIEK